MAVIPANAGIQKKTGFRVKPGMTNCIRLMSMYNSLLEINPSTEINYLKKDR